MSPRWLESNQVASLMAGSPEFTSEGDTGLQFEFERQPYAALVGALRQMLDAGPPTAISRAFTSAPFAN